VSSSPGALVAQTLVSTDFQAKLKQALPKSISPDRFTRCVITAIQANPGIVEGEKSSLYSSIVQAAQAGINLDGKEGALVIFNTKQGNNWVKKVQFMPMVGGIIKRLGGAGISVDTQVVHANDTFDVEYGDNPRITHKPPPLGTDRGEMIGAYAICKTRTGEVYREIMDKEQIAAVRSQSRAADSLMWTKFASEAWRKTVLRRCAKRIPILDDLTNRTMDADDQSFEFAESDIPSVDPESVVSEQSPAGTPQFPPTASADPVPASQPLSPAKTQRRPKALAAVLEHRDPEDQPPPHTEADLF
jgi:recombination protein RecT